MPASPRRRRLAALIVLATALTGAGSGAPRAADLMEHYLRAIEFDPEFQRARLERQVAALALRESRGGLMPGVNANLEASKVNQNIIQSDNFLFQEGRSDFYNTGLTLSLTQPIFRLDVLARLPQARAELRQAEAVFAAAEQDLVFRLAQAHFNLLAAHSNLTLSSAERQAIVAQLQEAEQRLASGLVTLVDVQDLRGRAALAQAAEVEAEDTMEDARNAMAEITGQAPTVIKVLGDNFPFVLPEQNDEEAWVRSALFQNPRIQAVQAAVEAAQQEIRRQRGAYMPAFDFVATFTHTDSGGTVFGEGNEIQNRELGLRLAVPLFDGGRASARVQASALRRSSVLQELEKEKRRVERETRASFRGVTSGVTKVYALDASVFAHQAALSVKEQGWRSGVNTSLIVLDARKELFTAMRDQRHARYLYILHGLKLKQSAGILSVEDLKSLDAYLQ